MGKGKKRESTFILTKRLMVFSFRLCSRLVDFLLKIFNKSGLFTEFFLMILGEEYFLSFSTLEYFDHE